MRGWKAVNFEIKGITWMLMHNSRLANPLDEYAKELKRLSSKRKKTDSDYEAMADVEWEGGLYRDSDDHVVIPGIVLEGCAIKAAKKRKMGDAFKSSFYVDGDWPLIYPGPKDIDALKADSKFRDVRPVRVQRATIMRTRPKFEQWSLNFTCQYDPGVLNQRDIIDVLSVGTIGDFSPRFGRFEIISPAA